MWSSGALPANRLLGANNNAANVNGVLAGLGHADYMRHGSKKVNTHAIARLPCRLLWCGAD
jgi:hypothetical protein